MAVVDPAPPSTGVGAKALWAHASEAQVSEVHASDASAAIARMA
jgi:hypothetical protein